MYAIPFFSPLGFLTILTPTGFKYVFEITSSNKESSSIFKGKFLTNKLIFSCFPSSFFSKLKFATFFFRTHNSAFYIDAILPKHLSNYKYSKTNCFVFSLQNSMPLLYIPLTCYISFSVQLPWNIDLRLKTYVYHVFCQAP